MMPAREPAPAPKSLLPAELHAMDWESFFRDYRQPGFVPGYRIVNKLGSGVFGDVYRAEKLSIGKPYAIKFLRLLDEDLREPVLRELSALDALAELDHPRLVSIEDRGEVHGIPYIVMGFAGDQTLRNKLSGRPMDEAEVLRIFRQIVEGVSALHERGVVHFDLKPANVFLRGDLVRVGDYGLSRLMSASRATLSMGRGTPHYMAPEMLRRRGDARSDVYSLGVIGFEMLAGRVPFTGDTEWEVLEGHRGGQLEFPDGFPAAWRPLLTKALAKEPEARFEDAGVLLRALDALTAAPSRPMTLQRAPLEATLAPPPLPHLRPAPAPAIPVARPLRPEPLRGIPLPRETEAKSRPITFRPPASAGGLRGLLKRGLRLGWRGLKALRRELSRLLRS